MTIKEKFLTKVNNSYSKISQSELTKTILKDSTDVSTAIVSVLSNTGIAGFKFNIPQKEIIKMQSEITDHFVDTNSPVQDHIARKPVTITLQGLQGEFFYSVNQIEDTLAKVVPTLTLVNQFLPELTPHVMKLKTFKKDYIKNLMLKEGQSLLKGDGVLSLGDKFNVAWNTLNGVDMFKTFQSLYKFKSSQTRAFFFFEALWNSRQTYTIETTWKQYENMAVMDIQPVRDNNADITDFTITFKQINVTASLYRSYDNAAGRTRQQLSEVAKKGVDKGKQVKTQ